MWGEGSIYEFDINLRAMMAAFYCGTGGADIAKAISFLGVPGGKSWERAFVRQSPKTCNIISSVVNGVIRKNLQEDGSYFVRIWLKVNTQMKKLTGQQYHCLQVTKATYLH